jgi:hypothetical protein
MSVMKNSSSESGGPFFSLLRIRKNMKTIQAQIFKGQQETKYPITL